MICRLQKELIISALDRALRPYRRAARGFENGVPLEHSSVRNAANSTIICRLPRFAAAVSLAGLATGLTVAGLDELKLPPPYATPTVHNYPNVIAKPEGAELHVPPGFRVDVYADGFAIPRF